MGNTPSAAWSAWAGHLPELPASALLANGHCQGSRRPRPDPYIPKMVRQSHRTSGRKCLRRLKKRLPHGGDHAKALLDMDGQHIVHASAYAPLANVAGEHRVQEHIGTDSKESLAMKVVAQVGQVAQECARPSMQAWSVSHRRLALAARSLLTFLPAEAAAANSSPVAVDAWVTLAADFEGVWQDKARALGRQRHGHQALERARAAAIMCIWRSPTTVPSGSAPLPIAAVPEEAGHALVHMCIHVLVWAHRQAPGYVTAQVVKLVVVAVAGMWHVIHSSPPL